MLHEEEVEIQTTLAHVDNKRIDPRNKLNDLTGKEWNYATRSVIETAYSVSGPNSIAGELRRQHPSPKPPQLCKMFVEFFTKKGMTVFDPFMGVGGILIASAMSGRSGIGIDINEKWIGIYKKASKQLGLKASRCYVSDCEDILNLKPSIPEVDFILTDPPYSFMLSKERTGEKKKLKRGFEARPFSENKADLGNMSYDDFRVALKKRIEIAISKLKTGKYLAMFCKDMSHDGKMIPVHSHLIEDVSSIPMRYKGLYIWYDKTINLYPFGYPYQYVPNQVHQYILIFQKA
ncbi:MAG: DNA methyltransferase [Nitrososphaerales archaeon]